MNRRNEVVQLPESRSGANDELLTLDEAAAWMKMSTRHVRRLVAERRIAFHKLGRSVRLSASDVAHYIAAGRVEPITESSVWNDLKGVA